MGEQMDKQAEWDVGELVELYRVMQEERMKMRTYEKDLPVGASEEKIARLAEFFVFESNEIEGYPRDGEGAPGGHLYDDHMDMTLRVMKATKPAVWAKDPKLIHLGIMQHEPDMFPGEFRQSGVMVGGRICMEPVQVRVRMEELLEKVNKTVERYKSGSLKSKAVLKRKAWEFHHEFEFIHPFLDGNGRTGRLWMNAVRLMLDLPWITIYAKNRSGYYKEIVDWIEKNEG